MKFLLILATAQMATQATHSLALMKKMGGVRSSSLVTLIFILITAPLDLELSPVLQAVCLGASFVGMSDPKRLSVKELGLASVAFAVIFNFFIHHFKGFGGALGFSAFISCLLVYFISTHVKSRFRS